VVAFMETSMAPDGQLCLVMECCGMGGSACQSRIETTLDLLCHGNAVSERLWRCVHADKDRRGVSLTFLGCLPAPQETIFR
jgi:hypothetical protein